MKRSDVIALATAVAVVLPFFLIPGLLDQFIHLSRNHPFLVSACEFALLGTFGECISLRITSGVYNAPGFGVLPRAFIWMFIGVIIKSSFCIFSTGAPALLQVIGFDIDPQNWAQAGFGTRILTAFSISTTMNLLFAPVFMTGHTLSNYHIQATGGTMSGLFTRPDVPVLFQRIDWNMQYGFVFKKTLPLFWIPAHTFTFMLPVHFQVLFAAVLGVVLGGILGFAGSKK